MIVRRRPSALTAEELSEILSGGQTDQVVFLPVKSAEANVAEALAALANAHGGVAVLGVTARGSLQSGIDVTALRDMAIQASLLTDPPMIVPTPQVVESDKGAAVIVQVPSGLPHIYSLQGRYLTRTAGQTRPLTTPELRRLLFERTDSGFESTAVTGATLADFDKPLIERYLTYLQVSPQDDVLQLLMARGCVTYHPINPDGDLVPTHAGMLLFGREPQRFLRSAEIICVRYSGDDMSDEFVRQDINGPLVEQIRQAEAFLVGNMRRGMRITGMAREDVSEYPIAVVREAIVNAVAHRDYSIRGEGIRLLMFNNRLTVYSPGRLPGHVTLDNLRDERYSRNEAVVAILSDWGYIERLGYGIDRMLAAMQEIGLPEPVFEETAAGFQVTLYAANDLMVNGKPELRPAVANAFLSDRQVQALDYVRANGRITNSDYQSLVPDVSSETIRRDLADLVERDYLIKVGSKRATYYILK